MTAPHRQLRWILAAGAVAAMVGTDVSAELGVAETKVACCQLTTSLASNIVKGSDTPGDERFYQGEGTPPNIHFILDNSGSMQDLPQAGKVGTSTFFNSDPSANGCSNTYLLAYQTAKSWNAGTETGAATAYPFPDQGTGLGSDSGPYSDLFASAKIYKYDSWGYSFSPTATHVSKTAACQSIWPSYASSQATQYNDCLSCLNTRGFYKKPGVSFASNGSNNQYFLFTGNMLNFNPPKLVSARAVMKRIVKNLRRVRMGMSAFSGADGGDLLRSQNPPCNLSLSEGSNFDSNRANLVNNINGLTFTNSTPLAETLFNVGQYFSSSDAVYTNATTASVPGFGFASSYLKNSYKNGSLNGQQRSVCWGCQVNAVIIITDGQPTEDDNLPRAQIKTQNGGSNVICPDYDLNGTGDCAAAEAAASDDMLDDVAQLLATKDLQRTANPVVSSSFNTAGNQVLNTYAIGFAVDAPILRHATEVGSGEYFEAQDQSELEAQVLATIARIQTRATSFSAASVPSLQVNRTGGSVLPRFIPNSTPGKSNQGLLYRFELGAERVSRTGGSYCNDAQAATVLTGGAGDPNDLNHDGDCDDVNLLDQDGDAVVEDDEGVFRKLDNQQELAKPYWEASKVMKPVAGATQYWKTRKIYTVIDNDSSAGSGTLNNSDTPIEFSVANAALLREYLGIPNKTDPCSALRTSMGLATMTATECAEYVIKWYRGADILNADPTMRDYDRSFLLADIFHSSPISVEPPTSKYFCGLTSQCTETLFKTKTPLADYSGKDAYEEYVRLQGKRDKVVLVGSNGGMLHAFHNGKYLSDDPLLGDPIYNQGTGEELWAFVPPDQLPRLKDKLDTHTYFVDGTAMVRDVWLNGVGTGSNGTDQIKQAGEFRTVAVTGMGEGGVHRFALDMTSLLPGAGTSGRTTILTSSSGTQYSPPSQAGDFLWMWPQPCDALSLQVGDSYGNFAPKPPPIGAVAIKNATGPITVNGTKAEERWIGFFNGGWDPYLSRGRGLAVVDLKTGNTLWSIFYNDGQTNAIKMKYPFVAPPAMLDLGQGLSSSLDQDYLFDTATLGDYGGSVWTVRFWKPGESTSGTVDGTSATKKVNNWYAARSFRNGGSTERLRSPFSFMTSNAIQPATGYLRTFIGSGDRFNLADIGGPSCRLSNPSGCARIGCTVRNTVTVQRGTSNTEIGSATYTSGLYTSSSNTALAAGNACSGARVTLSWDYDSTSNCGQASAGTLDYLCSGISTSWACSTVTNNWDTSSYSAGTAATASPDRFFGFWSYGGAAATRRFDTDTEATAYDQAYSGAPMSEANLTSLVTTTTSADAYGPGWYIAYTADVDERSGSGSTVLDGCVLWNSFQPVSGGTTSCAASGENIARFYQANYVTGQANCADSFVAASGTDGGTSSGSDGGTSQPRYVERTVVAVPGEPAPQWMIAGGVGTTQVLTLEAGAASGSSVNQTKELVQSVSQMELDKEAHECRHGGTGCK